MTEAEKIANLKDQLNKQELKIIKIINEIANSKETSNLYFAQKKSELNNAFRDINNIVKGFFNFESPKTYNKEIADQITKLKSYKTVNFKYLSYKEIINKDSVKQGYKSISNEGINTFIQGLSSGQKQINRLLYITQQINVTEKKLNEILQESAQGNISSNRSKMAIRKVLLDNVNEGKFINIIDKNGKPRNYNIKAYANLVARTKLREIQSEAALQMAAETQTDLIQVSSHNTLTEICQFYEGKIFSISGQNKDFPKIDMLAPFHINCKHSIWPVFEIMLKADGTYDKYVAFSNNEISKHPTRSSFIPVDERA